MTFTTDQIIDDTTGLGSGDWAGQHYTIGPA